MQMLVICVGCMQRFLLPLPTLLTAVNYEQAREKNLLCFWLILAELRLNLWLTVRAHKDCLLNWLTKNNLQAREE